MGKNKRLDWEINHAKVCLAIAEHRSAHGKLPTQLELSRLTKLSRETINKHFKNIDVSHLFESQRLMLATQANELFSAILNSALSGSVPAQKLALQIVFNWSEPKISIEVENDKLKSPEEIEYLRNAAVIMLRTERQRAQNKSARHSK